MEMNVEMCPSFLEAFPIGDGAECILRSQQFPYPFSGIEVSHFRNFSVTALYLLTQFSA